MTDLKGKLENYLDAGVPIIYINSYEEKKTDNIIKSVIGPRRAFEWSYAYGIKNFNTGERETSTFSKTKDLKGYLQFIIDSGLKDELNRKILILKDIHFYLDSNPEVVALLKHICIEITKGLDSVIMIVAPVVKIPIELEKFITIIEPEYPDEEDVRNFIQNFAKENEAEISKDLLEEMIQALKGLTESEIEFILQLALATKGEFDHDSLKFVFTQKQQMIRKSGILEMLPLMEKIEDIGGLENLKDWLKRKVKILKKLSKAKEFGVDMPKGVLIAGVPGCGKSLVAKVTAQMFEVPLLRLDMGKILGKYVGESESNIRKAIALADAISPCVLWIDELEKAFAGIGSDGEGNEVTTRLFGTFLTWMQEKKTPTFVIATGNKITKLPSELLRKGRFDEIFYVDLPNEDERKKIFEIHIKKRRENDWEPIKSSLEELAKKTKGYSGADLEGVVKDAIESAFTDGKDKLTKEYIVKAIGETHSLSEIMKEEIDEFSKKCEEHKFRNASKSN